MQHRFETKRFIIRPLEKGDVEGIFALDSDPDVHEFLGKNPITTISEAEDVIQHVFKQYEKNGIGRMAVIDKSTNDFIGWTGLKIEREIRDGMTYYDLGYRFRKKYWGQGIATETSIATLKFGFETLMLDEICGAAEARHIVSNKILKKVGLSFVESFEFEGESCNFYRMTKEEWNAINSEGL